MYPGTNPDVPLMTTRSRDGHPLPRLVVWNSSISPWQRLNIWNMLYERSLTINRRRSRALFSNTCQQRTCLNRLYKHAHKSYNIERWTPSLRTTSRLVHYQTTTSCLEHALRQRALSRTLRPSHHPSSSDNGNLRR